jgi:glycosyltransferase involved in cell wall biosynthesis
MINIKNEVSMNTNRPDISVITPSRNMVSYLKCCAASIADQTGITVEHIVVDAMSNDGTGEWLHNQQSIKYLCEADRGMYDAINKGLKLSSGKILGYLNCDEQYLPGALQRVSQYFDTHPHIDILFGHALLLDTEGNLLAFRKAYRPRRLYIATSILYNLSCAMFFRRKLIDDGFSFDETFKTAADFDFVIRVLQHGFRADYLNEYLATFQWTGNNLSVGKRAAEEIMRIRDNEPGYIKTLSPGINMLRYIEKTFSGAYSQRFPLEYDVYTSGSLEHRKPFVAHRATYKWPEPMKKLSSK